MQTQIHEGLEICFRFLSILSPYWKDAGEKGKTLRDLLSIYANRNKQQDDSDGEEDEGDDEDYDEDGDNDNDNDSGGGGIEDDDGDDDYSADDDGGAEQSLQDLIIADALLDLSNRPPRDDYGWRRRRTTSRSLLTSSSSFSLPLTSSPPPEPQPPLRLSRSGSSLSEYRHLGTECQSFTPATTSTTGTTTTRQRRTIVHQYSHLPPTSPAIPQHITTPSDHFATTTINDTVNSASATTATTTISTTTTNTNTTSTITDPITPIRFVDRVNRGQEALAGEESGGIRKHVVDTGVSAFLKMDKNRTLPPPPSPATTLHHHIHNHRQITTWIGGGVYPECSGLDETTLISLEKLCLSIEPPFN